MSSINNSNLDKETSNNENFYFNKRNSKEFLELKDKFKGQDQDLKSLMKLENYNKVRSLFLNEYQNLCLPGQFLNKNLGNIYTGSLYLGILALIINPKINLMNKRVMMFSYGSGCAATLFVLRVVSSSINEIREKNIDLLPRLQNRIKVSPQDYNDLLSYKESLYNSNNYIPKDKVENLFENTFFLEKVDDKWRRHYSKYTSQGKTPILFNKLSNNSSALRRLGLIGNHLKMNSSESNNINSITSLPSSSLNNDNNVWSGFYKKSIYEKQLHVN
jgi:hydroxymethylglutaryl-CoA synthase